MAKRPVKKGTAGARSEPAAVVTEDPRRASSDSPKTFQQPAHAEIRQRLLEWLDPLYPGVEIDVEQSPRWKRLCLTLRHARFARLLPEQRFRSLLRLIPPEFFESQLRQAVWLELAPGETTDDLLRAKRSEEVVGRRKAIVQQLARIGFFDGLRQRMGDLPEQSCGEDFELTRRVLSERKMAEEAQRDVCLLFIHFGAYCDCEALSKVPALLDGSKTRPAESSKRPRA